MLVLGFVRIPLGCLIIRAVENYLHLFLPRLNSRILHWQQGNGPFTPGNGKKKNGLPWCHTAFVPLKKTWPAWRLPSPRTDLWSPPPASPQTSGPGMSNSAEGWTNGGNWYSGHFINVIFFSWICWNFSKIWTPYFLGSCSGEHSNDFPIRFLIITWKQWHVWNAGATHSQKETSDSSCTARQATTFTLFTTCTPLRRSEMDWLESVTLPSIGNQWHEQFGNSTICKRWLSYKQMVMFHDFSIFFYSIVVMFLLKVVWMIFLLEVVMFHHFPTRMAMFHDFPIERRWCLDTFLVPLIQICDFCIILDDFALPSCDVPWFSCFFGIFLWNQYFHHSSTGHALNFGTESPCARPGLPRDTSSNPTWAPRVFRPDKTRAFPVSVKLREKDIRLKRPHLGSHMLQLPCLKEVVWHTYL